MRIKFGSALIPLNLLVWALSLFIFLWPSTVLRIILGAPFLLFFPGYTLISALFPKKTDMGGVERAALSFGLSIAIAPLIGLLLNYTRLGIRLETVLISVAAFILITSIVAWVRRYRLAADERFNVEISPSLPRWGKGNGDKIMTVVAVIAVLGAVGVMSYILSSPKPGEIFTEFYVLDAEGGSANYPGELRAGEEARVILSVVNHEGREASYRIEVVAAGELLAETDNRLLADEQKWQEELTFSLDKPGSDQKVEFILFKDGEAQPYLEPLYLWLNVVA